MSDGQDKAIFRAAKLKRGRGKSSLGSSWRHQEEHDRVAEISNPDKTEKNRTAKTFDSTKELYAFINKAIKKHNDIVDKERAEKDARGEKNLPRNLRKDAAIACECIFTFSPEMTDKIKIKDWVKANLDFIQREFVSKGAKTIRIDLHMDESTPHIHFLFVPDQEFEGSNSGSAPSEDPALNPNNGTIPQDGDTYEYSDYIYTYQTSYNGWRVAINTTVTDKNQTSYGAILESINGEPITGMHETFRDCTNLTTAPEIPSSVTNMFKTFTGCTSLVTAPFIPNNVTDMAYTFTNCTSLSTASTIPSGVRNIGHIFAGCTSLTGTIEINADNLTTYTRCFMNTTKSITLTGTSTQLTVLAATANNGNVTVQ